MPLRTTLSFAASAFFLLLMAGLPQNVSAQAPARDSSRFVEVPGGRLWVESQGSGSPLVRHTGHFFDAQARKDRVEWLVGTLSPAAGTGRGTS